MNFLQFFITLSIFGFFGTCFSSVKKTGTPRPLIRRAFIALFSSSITLAIIQILEARYGITMDLQLRCSLSTMIGLLCDYYSIEDILGFFKKYKIEKKEEKWKK